MARPVKQRKIITPYNELALIDPGKNKPGVDPVMLLTEEFESVKLIDYEGLDHSRASELMKVSRPTFTRIYKKARIKIAVALVENRSIQLSEGNIYFGDNWYKCADCQCIFNITAKSSGETCPVCRSRNILKQ
jgi:predicted DNA-binding protein (UPF0251 family)